MNRDQIIARLRDQHQPWDVLVVGGGATGLGCAVDAASRGLRTALVERGDFAHGTSSRSTKLAHGGVRYLRAGQMALVAQSLRERERLTRNAPGLVHDTPFVVPAYRAYERAWYGAGLVLYGILAPASGATRVLSRDDVLKRLPAIRRAGLRGGILYHDGQFDDARLALSLARTAVRLGAAVANYVRVVALTRVASRVNGAAAIDEETGAMMDIPARVVINATGTGSDAIRRMDDAGAPAMIRASRGTHVVLNRSFCPGDEAVMIPRTDDGRVLFVIPWRGRLLLGTTDTAANDITDDPVPTRDDLDYLLDHAARYLETAPTLHDVRSTFAGLRPLLSGTGSTASLRRDHRVMVSPGGLVTIAGGKWTTFRLMAEHAVDRAVASAGLSARPCRTANLALEGSPWGNTSDPIELAAMGGEPNLDAIAALAREAARSDMARTVEDVLARRTRALFLDARGAQALAPHVSVALARELGRNEEWIEAQTRDFAARAARFLPPVD
jgi:glycerol-3-phosphate dehydrogenase